jgi:nicotinamidase-related amidase
MNMLAVPEQSQLLLIEPIRPYLDKLDDGHSASLQVQFKRLSEAADYAGVPRYFAVSGDQADETNWLSVPCRKSTLKTFSIEKDQSIWTNLELLEAMKKNNRERLFICGFWLDDMVTSAALEALSLGFDAHVIEDLTLASNRSKRNSAWARLNQYTVAPVSLRNLLYEWMIRTDDLQVRDDLKGLWEEQIASENGGASA